MSTSANFDKLLIFQSMELHAKRMAREVRDSRLQSSWAMAAESWRILIHLLGERCAVCGTPAIIGKYDADGKRTAYCAEHHHEVFAGKPPTGAPR